MRCGLFFLPIKIRVDRLAGAAVRGQARPGCSCEPSPPRFRADIGAPRRPGLAGLGWPCPARPALAMHKCDKARRQARFKHRPSYTSNTSEPPRPSRRACVAAWRPRVSVCVRGGVSWRSKLLCRYAGYRGTQGAPGGGSSTTTRPPARQPAQPMAQPRHCRPTLLRVFSLASASACLGDSLRLLRLARTGRTAAARALLLPQPPRAPAAPRHGPRGAVPATPRPRGPPPPGRHHARAPPELPASSQHRQHAAEGLAACLGGATVPFGQPSAPWPLVASRLRFAPR